MFSSSDRFYALHGCQEIKEASDVFTGMLRVFDYDTYALLDSGANLSFETPFLTCKFMHVQISSIDVRTHRIKFQFPNE